MARIPDHDLIKQPPQADPHPARWVISLERLSPEALSLGGGKAVNLAALLQAALPVPPGFCVTTIAYTASVGPLGDLVEQLDYVEPADAAHLAHIAAAARERILAQPLPSEIALAIRSALAGLGPRPVAVRSSATAEDLPGASFAGQQDSYLNVVGADAVLDAVRRCWASLWTDRAVTYRARRGISQRTVRLAVVVQRMVDAAVAGVLFTADPLTGRRHHTVIDASPGLGEAIVSGAVNPDHFVVETASGVVLERRLGDKRFQTIAEAGGGTRRIERGESHSVACLSDERLRELAQLGARVEALFGSPQDCEFALAADGTVWLTQARPITTLFPLPRTAPTDLHDLRVYFNVSVLQGFLRPMTPLGVQAFRAIAASLNRFVTGARADSNDGPDFLADVAGWLFVDITGAIRDPVGRRLVPFALDHMESRSAEILRAMFDDPRLAVRRGPGWLLVRGVIRVALRTRLLAGMLLVLRRPEEARAQAWQLRERLVEASEPPADLSPQARLELAERLLLEWPPQILQRVVPLLAVGLGSFALARRLMRGLARSDEWEVMRRSLPHNPTTQMDLALVDLSEAVRTDLSAAAALRAQAPEVLAGAYRAGRLPPVLQTGLAGFLERYGHRAVGEIDLGLPRWSDDPSHLLGTLTNYLQPAANGQSPREQFQAGLEAAEQAQRSLTARATRHNPLLGPLLSFLLGRGRALIGERETPKFLAVLLLARVRALLAPVGDVLVASGCLADTGDVWHLDFAEIRAGLAGQDLKPLVVERRARYTQELMRRHLPRVLLSDGTEPSAPAARESAEGLELRGTPASAGLATGSARVVLDPVGAHIEPGEILVAPSTDPGWTPLFFTAAGLVMEMGGPMSHGAVVAREYGIPAVVGVAGATESIATGQRVTVDGSAGTIALNVEIEQATTT